VLVQFFSLLGTLTGFLLLSGRAPFFVDSLFQIFPTFFPSVVWLREDPNLASSSLKKKARPLNVTSHRESKYCPKADEQPRGFLELFF